VEKTRKRPGREKPSYNINTILNKTNKKIIYLHKNKKKNRRGKKKKNPRRTSAYNNGIKPFHVALLLEKTGVNCKDSSVVAPASILLKGSICLNYIR
ncbi:hypothetical protein, partial [Escherichia coli]|uniref:hypothetical protein n=1 Tax=Escherichia coli TaxID=562 RepID=UPI001BD03646